MNPLNPKKLLLTKWTAVTPIAKQKHFLVSRVIQPEQPTDPIQDVEIEAVFSKATQIIAWRELQNDSVWRQGWFDQESALKPKAVTKRFAISESSARRRVCSAEVLASRLAANGVSTLNAGGAVSERSQSSSSITTRSAPCFLF